MAPHRQCAAFDILGASMQCRTAPTPAACWDVAMWIPGGTRRVAIQVGSRELAHGPAFLMCTWYHAQLRESWKARQCNMTRSPWKADLDRNVQAPWSHSVKVMPSQPAACLWRALLPSSHGQSYPEPLQSLLVELEPCARLRLSLPVL